MHATTTRPLVYHRIKHNHVKLYTFSLCYVSLRAFLPNSHHPPVDAYLCRWPHRLTVSTSTGCIQANRRWSTDTFHQTHWPCLWYTRNDASVSSIVDQRCLCLRCIVCTNEHLVYVELNNIGRLATGCRSIKLYIFRMTSRYNGLIKQPIDRSLPRGRINTRQTINYAYRYYAYIVSHQSRHTSIHILSDWSSARRDITSFTKWTPTSLIWWWWDSDWRGGNLQHTCLLLIDVVRCWLCACECLCVRWCVLVDSCLLSGMNVLVIVWRVGRLSGWVCGWLLMVV